MLGLKLEQYVPMNGETEAFTPPVPMPSKIMAKANPTARDKAVVMESIDVTNMIKQPQKLRLEI